MTDRSLPVPEATTAAYKAKDGKTYRITTYVEAFTPGYYMVVGSADGTDSAQSYDAIAKAGVEYLRKYDCKAGFSHYRNRETYDAQSKSWLIAGECAVS
ncbi:MAG: hypothetical protein ORN49_00940 [Rhodobacteraceae bacterium]|nr:hypothetical protein [Paracoccaceae bacterium]